MPSLARPRAERSALHRLLPVARETAARRGEVIQLRIAESGAWRMEGSAGAAGTREPIAAGEVEPFPGLPLTLVVSPLGSCTFDARSAEAARAIALDPLACEVIER